MLVLLAVALTGCGGQGTHGTATLWVTRDRGAHVLLVQSVPAGETAMQALTRAVKLRFDEEGIKIPFPQRELHVNMVRGRLDDATQEPRQGGDAGGGPEKRV